MKTKITKLFLAAILGAFGIFMCSACSSIAKIINQTVEVNLVFDAEEIKPRFADLDYGLRVDVATSVANEDIIDKSEAHSSSLAARTNYVVTPSLGTYLRESMPQYIRKIGIPYNSSMSNDYVLRVKVNRFVYKVSQNATATVMLEYELEDAEGKKVIAPMTSSARVHIKSASELFVTTLERAYIKALNEMDWDRIASYLKIHASAKSEKNRAVEGSGNTALESTIIRWNIVSSPLGADVSWRVVSSTPDVKNTNSNYVGTTPYETTESFDIKGLTYNNSGNVQIEVSCEKPGYIMQKKRFNLRQAIDQKEISAKFNLVKDE